MQKAQKQFPAQVNWPQLFIGMFNIRTYIKVKDSAVNDFGCNPKPTLRGSFNLHKSQHF